MAYSPRVWLDRAVQFANRYRDQNNNQITLTADPGTVTQAGTPVNAANLNQMENAIAAAHVTADGALQRTGGIMTGDINADISGSVERRIGFKNGVDTSYFYSNTLGEYTGVYGSKGGVSRHFWQYIWSSNTFLIDGTIKYQGDNLPRMRVASGGTYVEWWNGTAWQGLGGIKSVQRGVSASSNLTITISAVNMSKSFVTFNNVGNMATDGSSVYRASLTSSTTLVIAPGSTWTGNANFAWEVVEFY
ncbi:hypothetical protein [Bacillus sp. 3255]|uniref:hypothetical protein n=1 Tax=Bacillus sp. 3255 TaxID=2817904 RepID=UPI00285DC017|nr:hypothetical protein [Bacillus sp. 3255]MDR6883107.1 hypothetical protein [Bacillus sp. 3255]